MFLCQNGSEAAPWTLLTVGEESVFRGDSTLSQPALGSPPFVQEQAWTYIEYRSMGAGL